MFTPQEIDLIRSQFIASSQMVEPMDLFEPDAASSEELARTVLGRCEQIAGKREGHTILFWNWLNRVFTEKTPVIFHGGVIWNERTTDIDVLSFDPLASTFWVRYVGSLHLAIAGEPRDGTASALPALLNTLLVLNSDEATLRRISESRDFRLQRSFLELGVGELLSFTIYKLLDEWRKSDIVRSARQHDPFGPGPNTSEIMGGTRRLLCELNEVEVVGLTRTAIARLRVKEAKKAGLEKQFLVAIHAKRHL